MTIPKGYEDSRQNRLRSERKAVELQETAAATARRQVGQTRRDIESGVVDKWTRINRKQRPDNEPSGGTPPAFEY